MSHTPLTTALSLSLSLPRLLGGQGRGGDLGADLFFGLDVLMYSLYDEVHVEDGIFDCVGDGNPR